MEEYCTCGHEKNMHTSETNKLSWQDKEFCVSCCYEYLDIKYSSHSNWEHSFKLDNLRLIEQIAKQRNLIN